APTPSCISGSLRDLIYAMRRDGVEEILDLHRNWRSFRVRTAFSDAKHRLPPKYALRRRLMVYARWLKPAPVPPLLRTYRRLCGLAAAARAVVSNDSAVLHLGPALGIPAVGVFGGTVPQFGFARQGPLDEVAEIELGCRPCGVHGRSRCPLGHHACMKRLDPD